MGILDEQEENKPFLYIVNKSSLLGLKFVVSRMDYDKRAGDYIVTQSREVKDKPIDWVKGYAQKWAESEGLEVR